MRTSPPQAYVPRLTTIILVCYWAYFDPFTPEYHLKTFKVSFLLQSKHALLHYKDQPVNALQRSLLLVAGVIRLT
jgi:hypothetical protein